MNLSLCVTFCLLEVGLEIDVHSMYIIRFNLEIYLVSEPSSISALFQSDNICIRILICNSLVSLHEMPDAFEKIGPAVYFRIMKRNNGSIENYGNREIERKDYYRCLFGFISSFKWLSPSSSWELYKSINAREKQIHNVR